MNTLLITLLAFAQRPAPPVKSHNVAIDNEHVRVIDAMNVPGQKSRLHKHDVNRVMVHLDAGTMRIAHQDGRVDDIKFKAGDVRLDPAGGMHTSENTGGADFHIVEIELKKPGGASAPKGEAILENSQVRVVKRRLEPGKRLGIGGPPAVSVVLLPGGKSRIRWGEPDRSGPAPQDVVFVEIKSAAR